MTKRKPPTTKAATKKRSSAVKKQLVFPETDTQPIRPARILCYDLEVSPLKGYSWQTFQTDVIRIDEPSRILCFSYAIIEPDSTDYEVKVVSLMDFPKHYRKNQKCDLELVKVLHRLHSNCDYTLGYNQIGFDNRITQTAFLRHNLPPTPHTVRHLDLLKIVRRRFKFPVVAGSNKLDDVCKLLLGEGKAPHDQQLWFDVMAGDVDANRRMSEYAKQDCELTIRLFHRIRGFIQPMQSFSHYSRKSDCCPVCQGTEIIKQGFRYTKTKIIQRYQCSNPTCGHYFSADANITKTKVVL